MIPRIRGRSGLIESGEHKDKWGYELSLWTLDGETQIGGPWQLGPFKTKEEAQEAGMDATRLACETIEKGIDGKVSGKYLDFKNGAILRPWNNN